MKTRQEFIETEYVNGVYNPDGTEAIRPLNEKEIEWLSQFYAETEHGNFVKTKEIEAQEELYKGLCRELRNNQKFMSAESVALFESRIDEAYKKMVHLRSETNTFYPEDEERHEIYNKENRRNSDIYSISKASNKLISFDITEFDQFTSRAEKGISPENLVLDYLVKKPVKRMPKKRAKKES